jgi:hypothetical protein
VIHTIDHIVYAVPSGEQERLGEQLLASGFRPTPLDLDFPEIGAASRSYAMASGGFVEFVYETQPGVSPQVWFSGAPRVIGVGFSSDDFERDVGAWGEPEGMWQMDELKPLPDGSTLRIHAAGPHPHFEPFYVFVMDTPELPYAHLGADARLKDLTFSGAQAEEWRQRLSRWLAAKEDGEALRVGGVQLSFRDTRDSEIQVVPRFSIPGRPNFTLRGE